MFQNNYDAYTKEGAIPHLLLLFVNNGITKDVMYYQCMKKYSISASILYMITVMVSFSLFPAVSEAATQKPSCQLSVETSRGETSIDGGEKVLLIKNEEITISWESSNAKKAFTANRQKIELEGSATSSPIKNTTYRYYFESGTKKVTCEVTVVVVQGSIKSPLTFTESVKPKITGTAKGLKTVQVTVTKNDATKPLFIKKNVKVINGKWTVTSSKKLKSGTYTVTLLGAPNLLLNTIATSTLRVGTGTKGQKQSTTFVVELVPLLVGGQAKPNATMPVLYLQVINIGKTAGTIKSFEVKQNGSAKADVVAGLSISNEVAKIGSIQAEGGKSIFKNNIASIPVSVTILPQQMQLFTLKATVGNSITTQVGKQIKLDISSIATDGTMQSVFPVRGTTWTIVN